MNPHGESICQFVLHVYLALNFLITSLVMLDGMLLDDSCRNI
jgi:hypothetical protein